jgi:hypothetical protein
LLRRVRFANLVASLSVRDLGGALAAPGWADVCDWWSDVDPGSRFARDYGFLEELLPVHEHRVHARAVPTIGFTATPHDHGRHGPRPTHHQPVGAYRHPVPGTVPVTSQENP